MIKILLGLSLAIIGFIIDSSCGSNVQFVIRRVVPLLFYVIGVGIIIGCVLGFIFLKSFDLITL